MSTAESTSFLVGLGLSPFRRVVVDVSGLIPPFRPPGGGIDQPPLITRNARLGGLTIGLATGGDEPVMVLTVEWSGGVALDWVGPVQLVTASFLTCDHPLIVVLEVEALGLDCLDCLTGLHLMSPKSSGSQWKSDLGFLST